MHNFLKFCSVVKHTNNLFQEIRGITAALAETFFSEGNKICNNFLQISYENKCKEKH